MQFLKFLEDIFPGDKASQDRLMELVNPPAAAASQSPRGQTVNGAACQPLTERLAGLPDRGSREPELMPPPVAGFACHGPAG